MGSTGNIKTNIMYYLKEKQFRYLVVSWGRDDPDPFNFTLWRHKNSSFFKRYSKVIDITFYGRRLILEF